MTDFLGLTGTILLGLCALPEVISSIRKGYCGSSLPFLLVWFFGEVATLAYVLLTSRDTYLLLNYSFNIILILILLYYKTKIPKADPVKVIDNFLILKD